MKNLSFILVLLLLLSCNNNNNKTPVIPESEDSIVQALEEHEKHVFKIQRPNHYDVNDTIKFGELRILIDSVKREKVKSRIQTYNTQGAQWSYDIYIEFINTSQKQTITVPYLFFEQPKQNQYGYGYGNNDSGYSFALGTRLFFETKGNKIVKSFDILPGKTLAGRYHALGSSTSIYFGYGDIEEGEDDDTPKGYEETKAYVDIKDKLVNVQ